jgi:hypothetical protein
LLERDSRLQPPDDQCAARLTPLERPPPLRQELVEPAHRQPHFGGLSPVERHAAESARRHADDGEAPAVDSDRAAHNQWIAAESALPEAVADHRNRVGGSGPVLSGAEASAGGHSEPERLEVVGGDVFARQKLGPPAGIEAEWYPNVRHQAGEDVRLLPIVQVVRIGGPAPAGIAQAHGIKRDQPVGLVNWKGPEEDSVDQTEKRPTRSNAECQTEDRNGGEANTVTERAGREAKISQQRFQHIAFPGVSSCLCVFVVFFWDPTSA